ncbi:MAG: response regulator [Lachnospiraceae bacterium]|nr:response regulator [Lachnospiraceae bacterium]
MKDRIVQYMEQKLGEMGFEEFLTNLFFIMVISETVIMIPIAVADGKSGILLCLMFLLAVGMGILLWINLRFKRYVKTAIAAVIFVYGIVFPFILLSDHSFYVVGILWFTTSIVVIYTIFGGPALYMMLFFFMFEYCYLYSGMLFHDPAMENVYYQIPQFMSMAVAFAGTMSFFLVILYVQQKYYLYQNRRIMISSRKIERAGTAKSQFLTNMSYEIRTPMNSIINISEIMLKEEMNGEIRTEVNTIRGAAYDLLAIIDDVLTYARIDSGNMHLIKEAYSFEKLAKEIVQTVSEELQQKKLFMDVKIDHAIPKLLLGDSVVIRQIFLYLLFISIESTDSGRIALEITCDNDHENHKCVFHCKVADTGRGLSEIDIRSLFGMYNTYDSRQSSNLKGIGLKFSICKELLSMMQGDIRVESIEGIGLCTYFSFENEIIDESPMISLESGRKPNVLIYASEEIQINKWQNIMEGFGVRPAYSRNYYGFDRAIQDKHFDFIFVPDKAYENLSNIIALYQCEEYTYVMAEHNAVYGDFGRCRLIYKPFTCISVADVLNHNWKKEDYRKSPTAVAFTAKNAKVLVVDDNVVNLKVASGIFSKYGINIAVATCGKDSLRKIESERYDLILMDMVMPDISGSDVLKQIREKEERYYKEVPIVALTAQNGANVREQMLELGFQEYLTKPIKRRYLEQCLLQFLPEELIEKVIAEDKKNGKKNDSAVKNSSLSKKAEGGLNIEKGLSNIGGSEDGYAAVLNSYYAEGLKYLDTLPKLLETGDIQLFTTNVHGIKSSSASIGATEVSVLFRKLEYAGKNGRIEEINQRFPASMEKFKDMLEIVKEYLVRIGKLQETAQEENLEDKEKEELTMETLTALKAELDRMNLKVTDYQIPELASRNFGPQANGQIRKLKEAYEAFDFHQVKAILNDMIASIEEISS